MVTDMASPIVGEPVHKYLVFTSAGDVSCLQRWLKGDRNFDLWVTYYGDHHGRYRELADYYNVRKDGKFPNLHYVYQMWPDLLQRYEAVLVLDDDLLMNASAISRLFDIRAKHDLWLVQPAYVPGSKISHTATKMRRTTLLRYTNFVEVGCPLFRKDKLDCFMETYDPSLVGWGVDWWFLDVLGPDLEGRVAVVDAAACQNPYDRAKGGEREIDKLQSKAERIATWQMIKARYNIESEMKGIVEYGALLRSRPGQVIGTIRWAVLKGAAIPQCAARLYHRRSLKKSLPCAQQTSPRRFRAYAQERKPGIF